MNSAGLLGHGFLLRRKGRKPLKFAVASRLGRSMISLHNYRFAVWAAILAVAIVSLNLFAKGPFLLSSALILDDLHLFPESIFSDLQGRAPYFWAYSKINQLAGSPGAVRAVYLIMLAMSGVAFFAFLSIWRCDKVTAVLLSFLAIMAPTNVIMISFINGSYSILFFFVFSLGLVAISRSFFLGKRKLFFAWGYLLSGTLLVFLSSFFGTNSALLPVAILFLPWFSTPLYAADRKQFWLMALVASPIILLSSVLAILRVLSHPYTQIEGRILFDLSHLLSNAFILIGNVFKSFYEPMVSTGVAYDRVASTSEVLLITPFFLLAVVVGLVRFALSVKPAMNRSEIHHTDYAALLIPFFLITSILSIGPVAPNTRLHLWHMFLPSLFVLSTMFLVLRIYLNWRIFAVVGAVFALISSYTLVEASKQLNHSVEVHEALAEAVLKASSAWDENDELTIILPREPYLAGFNSMPTIRGSGFVRLHTDGNVYRSVYIAERRFLDTVLEPDHGAVNRDSTVSKIYNLNVDAKKLERQEQITDLSSLTTVEDAISFCLGSSGAQPIPWRGHISLDIFEDRGDVLWETQGTLSGEDVEIFQLPKTNDFVLIKFEFSPMNSHPRNGVPGISTPPTALLWRENGFQVWHIADEQWRLIMGLVNSDHKFEGRAFMGRILVVDDCFVQFEINDVTRTVLGPFRTVGSLQFGKGFNSRYWTGMFSAAVSRGNVSSAD